MVMKVYDECSKWASSAGRNWYARGHVSRLFYCGQETLIHPGLMDTYVRHCLDVVNT